MNRHPDRRTTRRRFLITAAQTGGPLALAGMACARAGAASRRPPNVLWIMTDDHRPDSLGCAGPDGPKTPHIDGIARRGVHFRHAFSQGPICTPSRSSIITGRYCHAIGVTSNGNRLAADAPFLTRPFQEAGYQLVNVGKKLPSPRIFDVHVRPPGYGGPGATPYELKPEFAAREEELGVLHLKEEFPIIIAGRYPLPADQTEPAITVTGAIRQIEQGLQAPWMLRVSIIAPHTPILAPEPFDAMVDPAQVPFQPPTDDELATKPRYEREMLQKCQGSRHLSEQEIRRSRACYRGLVSHVDDQIGRLLAAINERRLLDDTLVVITSDQGVLLGEHGLFMKRNFYEQSAGGILIVSWPGHLPEGKTIDDPVELIDVMPTMLDAAGVRLPSTVQGRSLLPLIAGREPGRDAVFCEIDFTQPQFERYYLPNSRRVMVRTREWKASYFVDRSGDARDGDLYHLADDPDEVRNLWGDKTYADVVARLEARVRQWDEEPKG